MSGCNNAMELLTVEELQSVLRVGKNKTYEIIRSGEISSIKIGRQIRIRKADVLEYLESSCGCLFRDQCDVPNKMLCKITEK
jgi:excisionase family DNA binding protein